MANAKKTKTTPATAKGSKNKAGLKIVPKTIVDTAIANSVLMKIKISELKLSPLNPRQDVNQSEIDTLALSIREVGCIQNLIGLIVNDDIEIVAGGRRLRALQQIIAEDKTPNRVEVVRIANNEEQAMAMIGAENHARLQPEVVDEIIAYKQYFDKNASPEDIGKAFGQTTRHVKGRLKLSNLHPEILQALRERKITLEVAGAYAFNDNQEEQLSTYNDFKVSWAGNDPVSIIGHFTNEMTDNSNALALFVTKETYLEAGGTVIENLFGDDTYFENIPLLEELASKRKEEIEAEGLKDGWKWTQFLNENIHSAGLDGVTYLQPFKVQLTKEEAKEYDELDDIIDNGEPSEEQEQRYQSLSVKLRETYYTPEQIAVSGKVYWLDWQGKINARCGLVKDQDRQEAIATKVLAEEKETSVSLTMEGTEQNAKKGYSEALREDLRKVRTSSVQNAILKDDHLAFDCLAFSVIYPDVSTANPFQITKRLSNISVPDDTGLKINDDFITDNQQDDYNYVSSEAASIMFAEFRALPKAEKTKLVTKAVASSFFGSLSNSDYGSPFVEMIATMSNAKSRDVWTPSASFFKRLKADQLDEIVSHLNGKTVSSSFAKSKKGDKVKFLDELFNDEKTFKTFDEKKQKRILAWLPEGLETPKTKSKSKK